MSQVEENLEFSVVACAFHHRNSTICCMSPNARRLDIKADGSQNGNRKSPHVDFVMPAIDCHSNTMKKEIIINNGEKGPLAKARQLVGQLRRSSPNSSSGHSRSGEGIEMHSYGPGLIQGSSMPHNGITVSYDVWQTIEEI